jgi:hypothetical protein
VFPRIKIAFFELFEMIFVIHLVVAGIGRVLNFGLPNNGVRKTGGAVYEVLAKSAGAAFSNQSSRETHPKDHT